MIWRRGVLDGRESLRPAGTVFESRLLRSAVDVLVHAITGGTARLTAAPTDAPPAEKTVSITLPPRPYGMPDDDPMVGRAYL